MRTSRLALFAAASLSLTMGGPLNPAVAEDHDWNGYHWADVGSGVTVTLAENLDATWESLLAVAANGAPNGRLGWDDSVLATPIVTGAGNPKRCRPTSGRVEVCNAEYGRTGWLGVAQIWLEGGHIVQGTAKQNDTYFKTEKYNKPEWRQFVICQEVGHTFGLDHSDENFSNENLGSCIDYTSTPAGPPSNEYPKHDGTSHDDFEMLASIYQHSHATTSTASVSTGSEVGNEPESWGRQVGGANRKGTGLFVRDYKGGHVYTFVIWA